MAIEQFSIYGNIVVFAEFADFRITPELRLILIECVAANKQTIIDLSNTKCIDCRWIRLVVELGDTVIVRGANTETLRSLEFLGLTWKNEVINATPV